RGGHLTTATTFAAQVCEPHVLRNACGCALAECRPRHASAAGVARASQHPAHGALYGNVAEPVSGLLAVKAEELALTVTALRQTRAELGLLMEHERTYRRCWTNFRY